jgi:hypothetical protein
MTGGLEFDKKLTGIFVTLKSYHVVLISTLENLMEVLQLDSKGMIFVKFIRGEFISLEMEGNESDMGHVHSLEAHSFGIDFEGDLADYVFN